MKKLQLIDSSRYSGIESELKLKKFELERCSLLLSESEEKQKQLCEEKDKLIEKLDVRKRKHLIQLTIEFLFQFLFFYRSSKKSIRI